MKRSAFVFAAVAASFALLSCGRMEEPVKVSAVSEPVNINVEVSSAYSLSKASGTVPTASPYQTADEQKVQSLQVFVFSGGALDGYSSATNSTSLTVECTAGARKIYAVVNGPDLSAIATESALLASKTSLIEDADNFVMTGSKEVTVAPNGSYSVAVSRTAAKIVIRSIKNDIQNAALKTLPFVVKRIYITNVASTVNIGGNVYATANDTWYNKGGYFAANNLGTFTNDVTLNATVANGQKYSTAHYYYCYPNAYAQANYAATWAPKRTMLVVQVKIGDSLYDYPIDLLASVAEAEQGGYASNKMYVLDQLTITKLGNPDDGEEGGEDEENPVTSSSVTFSVTVNDWTLVPVSDITI